MKTQSEKFKWGKTVNSVQVIPNDLTTSINNSDIQSLLIQPNMIPLDSVRIAAAECWGTYDMNTSPRAKIPTKLLANDLDPANDINDLKLFYERVRRTMIAKAILGMLKPTAVTTIMHKRTSLDGQTQMEIHMMMDLHFKI